MVVPVIRIKRCRRLVDRSAISVLHLSYGILWMRNFFHRKVRKDGSLGYVAVWPIWER